MIACILIPNFATAVERQKDPAYRRALDELVEVLASFTHRVEPGDPGTPAAYLDLGTLKWTEAVEMVQQVGQAVRDKAGLAPAVGLAGWKLPARVAAAAAEPNEGVLIAPGHEAAFLAPLPVSLLSPSEETARRLRLLGIHTLGQLATLPTGAILAQLGKEGHLLHQWARGRDDRPVLPYSPRAVERATRQLDDPVADRTILEAIALAMAGELAVRLESAGQASREMRVTLDLEDGTSRRVELVFRQPAAGSQPIGRTLVDLLAQVTYPCGVVGLEVVLADLIPARGEQLDLFVHRTRQESRLRDTLENLVARYGTGCFYRVSVIDQEARLPERRFRLQEASDL